ncbi:MAG: hypothetical protein JXR86_11430 [Spirochaetales bacterium]|nr:hypothetical protein [Spirochaetales bacterium]
MRLLRKKIYLLLFVPAILLTGSGCLMITTSGGLQNRMAYLTVKSINERESTGSGAESSPENKSVSDIQSSNLSDEERAAGILEAIDEGDYAAFESLLAPVDDVTRLFPRGTLLLHRAEEAMGDGGQVNPFTQLLVEKKAPILLRDSQGRYADYLIGEFGLEATDRDEYLRSIITAPRQKVYEAIRNDSVQEFKAVEKHLLIDGMLLKDTLGSWKAPAIAAYALEMGAPATYVDEKTGDNLLHMLCDGRPYDKPFSDLEDLAVKLIAAGADVNHKSKRGDTPLYLLIKSDSRDNGDLKGSSAGLARILLEAGSNPDAPCDYYDGTSMLYIAANNRLDDLVDLLLEFGVVIDKTAANAPNVTAETKKKLQG